MKKDIKDFMVMLAVGLVFALIVGAISGVVQEKMTDNYIEKLDTALQQTDEILEIQKLSEYKGQMMTTRDCFLEGFISPDYASAKAKTIIKTIDADHTGFANDIEVSLSIHWEQFPEETGNPIVIINTTIDEIDKLIDEIKAT